MIDRHGGQSDCGRGPSRTGFEKQPCVRRESRNFIGLAGRADDKRRQEKLAIPDTRERLLDHRSTADDFEEMLGPVFRGNRPQSRSPASRENDRLNSFHHAASHIAPARFRPADATKQLCNHDTILFYFETN